MVEIFGMGKVSNEVLVCLICENFDLCFYGLIKMLDLICLIYCEIVVYGYFGCLYFFWE